MSAPLHARIRADIEGAIRSGRLAPGARLETEHELMARYACARMTVSKALSGLASEGLIERRRRAGSFVARPRRHTTTLDVPDLAADIAARGQRYAFRLIARRRRRPRVLVEEECRLAGRGELIEIEGLHLADGISLAVEHRLVSLAAVPGIAGVDFAATAPGSWLRHHIPWTDAETRIAAEAATGLAAERLGIDEGAACLLVERRTWRERVCVSVSRQLFRGDTYDLVERFGPGGVSRRPA